MRGKWRAMRCEWWIMRGEWWGCGGVGWWRVKGLYAVGVWDIFYLKNHLFLAKWPKWCPNFEFVFRNNLVGGGGKECSHYYFICKSLHTSSWQDPLYVYRSKLNYCTFSVSDEHAPQCFLSVRFSHFFSVKYSLFNMNEAR